MGKKRRGHPVEGSHLLFLVITSSLWLYSLICEIQTKKSDSVKEATKLFNYLRRLKFQSLWLEVDWNELGRELHDT